MCNLTHTKGSEKRKRVGSDVDKDSDYRGMKIIRFKNIFRVSPMGMIPGAVSNDSRAGPTTVKSRTKTRTLPQVLMLENIELLVILALLRLLLSTIEKKFHPQGVLQIDFSPERKSMRRKSPLPQPKALLRSRKPRH